MKKVITFGLLGRLIMLAVGLLMSQLFLMMAPALKTEYENPNLFRPWSDPVMLLYFVHPFLLGTCLAWVWRQTNIIHFRNRPQERNPIWLHILGRGHNSRNADFLRILSRLFSHDRNMVYQRSFATLVPWDTIRQDN